MPVRPRHLGAVPVAAALAAGLAACGGGTSGTSSAAAQPATAASASAAASARAGAARQFQQRFPQIRQCLEAAGIAVPTLPAHPSFSPGAHRSFSPGARPSYSPGARPSGAPRRQGPFGAILANPQAQAALKACGLSMPSFSPRPRSTPAQ